MPMVEKPKETMNSSEDSSALAEKNKIAQATKVSKAEKKNY